MNKLTGINTGRENRFFLCFVPMSAAARQIRKRRKIHSDIKILCALGALPAQYRQSLHRSQVSRYARLRPQDFYGLGVSGIHEKEMEWIRQFGDFPTAKKMCVAILKLFIFFRSITSKIKGFHAAIRQQKIFFVELFQRFRDFIPASSFSKLIGTDETTLRNWIREIRVRCADSFINTCRKVHPNQLLASEISKMKKLLSAEDLKFWPSASVYLYALKNKIVSMSRSTWYKYASILNAERLKPKTVKVKLTGIRASGPNELWHADVMYFFTPGRVKLFIYTVMDNYSRFPLCVKVSDKLCGKFRTQTFREALRKALEIHPACRETLLMTDGGSENFNKNVEEFIRAVDHIPIKQIRALSGSWPSNSMNEALNKVIKTYYLNHMDIKTQKGLETALQFAVEDYSYRRPHGQLQGLTPFEAYSGNQPDRASFTAQLQQARKIRVAMNQNHNCTGKCHFK